MASQRVKGISIEIDGSTTKLQKALEDVDKSLSTTQKALKDVNKLLKFDPKNTELLTQKQKLLDKAVKDTEKRVTQLTDAQRQLEEAGVDKNSEQYQALQREIIATEQDLKKAQGALDKFNAEMTENAEETKKATFNLQDFGDKAKTVSDKTRALSTGAAALGTAMLGMAFNAGKTADDLLTLSRNTGISVEELQKMQYASDIVDVSMDQMTGSLSKLVKQMASGNDAFDTLGVSILDENGNMRDAVDVWYDTLEALSKVENETERDQIAMELFGKSAMDLSGIIDDGGQALRDMGQEAEDLGLIMSEDGVQAAGEFNDAIDKFKNQASQAFFEAGAALAESLLPMLEELIESVSGVITWFASLDGDTQTLILTILGLVAAISPIAGLISGICTIGGVLAGITAPMAGIFLAIAGAIAVVVSIGTVLYENWDTIKAKGQELWDSVVATWDGIKQAISDAIEGAKQVVSDCIDAIKGLFDFQISWPHIPLPHFSVSGSSNPIDWLTQGIPKVSVEWYAKAKNQPYMFNSPTIIGVGDVPEVVVGADYFKQIASPSISINMVINPAQGQSEEQIARAVSRQIQNDIMKKRAVWL